jgi:hypothetical protein
MTLTIRAPALTAIEFLCTVITVFKGINIRSSTAPLADIAELKIEVFGTFRTQVTLPVIIPAVTDMSTGDKQAKYSRRYNK